MTRMHVFKLGLYALVMVGLSGCLADTPLPSFEDNPAKADSALNTDATSSHSTDSHVESKTPLDSQAAMAMDSQLPSDSETISIAEDASPPSRERDSQVDQGSLDMSTPPTIDAHTMEPSDATLIVPPSPDVGMPDASPPENLCMAGHICLEIGRVNRQLVFARSRDDEGMEVIPDWCPASSQGPLGVNFLEGPKGAPQCTACLCQLDQPDCGIAPLFCSIGDDNCDDAQDLTLQLQNGCFSFAAPADGDIACYAEAPRYGGRCNSSGGDVIETPAFQRRWEMCGLEQGVNCGQTAVCLPNDERICYIEETNQPCLANTEEFIVYERFSDRRTCSSCQCSLENVSCSAETYRLPQRADCAPDFGPYPSFSSQCRSYNLPPGPDGAWSFAPQVSSIVGECTPGVSQGRGSVEARGEMKMCCFNM